MGEQVFQVTFEKFQNFQPLRQDHGRKVEEKWIVGWLRSSQTQSLGHEETSEFYLCHQQESPWQQVDHKVL
jgi:hypothetical protein